jgi:hypothetical protein
MFHATVEIELDLGMDSMLALGIPLEHWPRMQFKSCSAVCTSAVLGHLFFWVRLKRFSRASHGACHMCVLLGWLWAETWPLEILAVAENRQYFLLIKSNLAGAFP